MTERLPRITSNEIIRVLERHGFSRARSSGSHQIFKNSMGRRVTVPVHSGQTLHPKVLVSILREMGMTPEQLRQELGQ